MAYAAGRHRGFGALSGTSTWTPPVWDDSRRGASVPGCLCGFGLRVPSFHERIARSWRCRSSAACIEFQKAADAEHPSSANGSGERGCSLRTGGTSHDERDHRLRSRSRQGWRSRCCSLLLDACAPRLTLRHAFDIATALTITCRRALGTRHVCALPPLHRCALQFALLVVPARDQLCRQVDIADGRPLDMPVQLLSMALPLKACKCTFEL
jgi:hypothetical protein